MASFMTIMGLFGMFVGSFLAVKGLFRLCLTGFMVVFMAYLWLVLWANL